VQTLVVSRYPALASVDDFILLFLPPCGPYLTPLATRSLESDLLVSPLLGGPARHSLLRPLFTCTNANQAATHTCNTRPRVSSRLGQVSHTGCVVHKCARRGGTPAAAPTRRGEPPMPQDIRRHHLAAKPPTPPCMSPL
jgi:hypothetical protein